MITLKKFFKKILKKVLHFKKKCDIIVKSQDKAHWSSG